MHIYLKQVRCPKLEVLDLSGIWSPDNILFDIEKLQISCPLLRELRLAQTQLTFNRISVEERVGELKYSKRN